MIEPAHLWVPPRRGSFGDEAVDLAARAGRVLDDEQALAVDAMLSYGAGGRWVALESAILEARQNGKSASVLLPVVLFDLFLNDLVPDRIVWTAHLFRTARDSFDDFCTCIATSSELSSRVKRIVESHGEEAIELHSGSTLEFLARSNGGGRGLGGKRVVLDEALILGATTMGSLLPVLSARPDPQVNYGSSGAKSSSDQLHKLIKRGRAGGDPSLIWVEFCAPGSWEDPGCHRGDKCLHTPGIDGCKLDDESLWPLANHALGRTRTNGSGITYAYVRSERRTLSPTEFGRERFGWHEALVAAVGVIAEELWQSRLDAQSEARPGQVGIGIDASPGLASAAIGMTGVRADGRRHWQVLDHQAGVGWVAARLKALLADGLKFPAVGVDPASPAGALISDLKDEGLEVVEVTGRTLVQAWGAFNADVNEDRGRHIGQQTLDQAIRDAAAPPSGDVAKFSRAKSSGDICPIVAVTVSDHMEREAARMKTNDPLGAWR